MKGLNRRRFLKALAGASGLGLLATVGTKKADAAPARATDGHLAWVWQFDTDGEPDDIAPVLSRNQIGIILKTHEGTTWMSEWDSSPHAINGAEQVDRIAAAFESRGIPFHAWTVVEGRDPIGEARICADVLAHGARSLTLDLEPAEGGNYWHGGVDDAIAFGAELRRLQPAAVVAVAPDVRPWQIDAVPMAEFASFADEFAPQLYWPLFNNSANEKLLAQYGIPVGEGGVTPEVVLEMSRVSLGRFNKPIRPIGPGSADAEAWKRFLLKADLLAMKSPSVWRFGTSQTNLWPLLGDSSTPVFSTLYSTWLRLLGY